MKKELERKFLVKQLPNLDKIIPIKYERYFLKEDINHQIRIQRKNDKFEIETKMKINDLEYQKDVKVITEKKFKELSKQCKKGIIRDSYLLSINPEITLKVYHGPYEGLIRIEIEFTNEEELKQYIIPEWFGTEITNTKLGLDAKLIKLDREKFIKLLTKLEK